MLGKFFVALQESFDNGGGKETKNIEWWNIIPKVAAYVGVTITQSVWWQDYLLDIRGNLIQFRQGQRFNPPPKRPKRFWSPFNLLFSERQRLFFTDGTVKLTAYPR